MNPEISDGVITLRRDQTEFAGVLFAAVIESRTAEFMRWMPWLNDGYRLSETGDFIKARIESWNLNIEREYVIFETPTNEVIGHVGLNSYNEAHNFYNLGYWIRVSRQNQGIASRAARLLAEEAFKALEIGRIEILVAAENFPSQKAAEKAGAMREGVLRKRLKIGRETHDAVVYSFVKEDFDY